MKSWKTKSGYEILKVLGGRSNVFLVKADKYIILIDTSPAFMWRSLRNKLQQLKIIHIDFLILTHTHFDHAANAQKLKNEFGLKIIVQQTELHYLETGQNPLIHGTNRFLKALTNILASRLLKSFSYEPCHADIAFEDHYQFDSLNISIIHTPGHSEGSVSILVDKEIAMVGDALFGVFPNSVFPPFAQDSSLMVQSWEKLIGSGCMLFLPSHGNEKNIIQLSNDFQRRIV